MSKRKELIEKLDQTAFGIAHFLSEKIEEGGFPERNFYGEIFAAALWSRWPEHFNDTQQIAAAAYQAKKDKPKVREYNAFNAYGSQFIKGQSNVAYRPTKPFYYKVTNWLLLRAYLYLLSNSFIRNISAHVLLKATLMLNGKKNGQILDRRPGRAIIGDAREEYHSHQYHAFSLVLLSDIYELIHQKSLLRRIQAGLEWSADQIKANGEAIYKGRGKKQIFGYGSLIYALSWGLIRYENDEYMKKLEIVLDYLLQYQKEDGSFPLALAGNEGEYWESYNNLYDYLPFLGLMLHRSSEQLSS